MMRKGIRAALPRAQPRSLRARENRRTGAGDRGCHGAGDDVGRRVGIDAVHAGLPHQVVWLMRSFLLRLAT